MLTTHHVVGGIAALTGSTAGLSALAVTPTVTLELSKDAMEDVFEDSFPIFLAVLRALARDLVEILRRGPPRPSRHAGQRRGSHGCGPRHAQVSCS